MELSFLPNYRSFFYIKTSKFAKVLVRNVNKGHEMTDQEQIQKIVTDLNDILNLDVRYLLNNNHFEISTLKMIETKLLLVLEHTQKHLGAKS